MIVALIQLPQHSLGTESTNMKYYFSLMQENSRERFSHDCPMGFPEDVTECYMTPMTA
jgi:hypothetical protein